MQVVVKNVNPIEKVERSALLLATTLNGNCCARSLLRPSEVARVAQYSAPRLMTQQTEEADAAAAGAGQSDDEL